VLVTVLRRAGAEDSAVAAPTGEGWRRTSVGLLACAVAAAGVLIANESMRSCELGADAVAAPAVLIVTTIGTEVIVFAVAEPAGAVCKEIITGADTAAVADAAGGCCVTSVEELSGTSSQISATSITDASPVDE
jgi:hypothetical protein